MQIKKDFIMAKLQDKVMNHLLALIEQSQHDAALPSQNELQQRFDCSTVTVRTVLKKLEERGLIYRIQGKGCFVRRVEATPVSAKIFLIIAPETDLQGDFVSSLVTSSRKNSYHTLFYCYDDNEDMLFYELDRIEPQVVLWLAPSIFRYGKTLQKLLSRPQHVVLFNREYDHPAISYVCGDFVADGRKMGEELLKYGVRKALYVCLDMQMMYARCRAAGLQEVLAAAGCRMDIIEGDTLLEKSEKQAENAPVNPALPLEIAKKLRTGEYDALVGAQGRLWDIILQSTGHHPEPGKLVLANFNSPRGRLDDNIPAVVLDQPIAEMADKAIELVSRLLAGGEPERRLYPSQIVNTSRRHAAD